MKRFLAIVIAALAAFGLQVAEAGPFGFQFAKAGGGTQQPSLILDFTTGSADSRLTTSGGANGTRVNSSGVIVAATTPRFDYDPVTLAAKGLLVEEARTNLATQSAGFSTANWSKLLSASVAADTTVSPDGTQNADTITFPATAGAQVSQSHTLTAVAHVFTVYAKTASGTKTFRLKYYNGATDSYSSELTATTTWQRFEFAFTGAAAAGNVAIANNAGATAGDLIVWGAQLEAGSFATSYIATQGSTVLRSADSVTMTGANFSSWFNATQGTIVVDVGDALMPTTSSTAPAAFSINDNSANNRIMLAQIATARRLLVNSGGGASAQIDVAGTTAAKMAAAYALDDYQQASNGTLGTADTSGALPVAPSQLSIGSDRSGVNTMTGHIKTLRFFPVRLPNATLQTLTAP
jgi:hypothetical protein